VPMTVASDERELSAGPRSAPAPHSHSSKGSTRRRVLLLLVQALKRLAADRDQFEGSPADAVVESLRHPNRRLMKKLEQWRRATCSPNP
jgi:hypothetical protein